MKTTLQEVRKLGIFQEIEPPKIVYHMTDRKNMESILKEGKINSRHDFMNYFFPSLEEVPVYIELTGADHGRQYYDFDGRDTHSGTVKPSLKPLFSNLSQAGNQRMEWYIEKPAEGIIYGDKEAAQKKIEYFSKSRVCHYGPMRFKKNPQVIELTEIDRLPESEKLKEVRELMRNIG